MPDSQKTEPLLELFKNVAGASLILAALLYAAGWTSLHMYYKSFGLDVTELDVPIYHALIYSLPVLFDGWASALIVLGSVILVGILLSIKSVRKHIATPAGTAVAFTALLVVGFLLSMWGARVGRQHAQRDLNASTSTLPTIAIELEVPAGSGRSKDMDFDKLEFKYLAHAKTNYYLFRPFGPVEVSNLSLPASNVEVYVIPDSRVRKIRLQRGVD